VFGQSVTFTAKVKAPNPLTNVPPDGETVEFFIDGVDKGPATLTGGVATYTTSTLSRSTTAHTIEVDYAGDQFFQPSSNAFSQTVNKAATPTSVTLSAASLPLVYGQTLTLTASVAAKAPGAGTPTGTVNFYADVVSNANLITSKTLDGTGT